MTVSIIVRAQDPEACANFYGALGIRFEPPGRLHPGAWRARITMDVEIIPGEGTIDPRLSVRSMMPTVVRALESGGHADYARVAEVTPVVVIRGPCGASVTLEERTEERFAQPVQDVAKVFYVLDSLRSNRPELDALLNELGLSSPRLVGPASLGSRRGGDFVLVVDGRAGADLQALDAFLERIRSGPVRAVARLAEHLPADLREYLEAVAFEI